MTPLFALILRHDGITLLHREAQGWSIVGATSLENPDIAGGLAILHGKAVEIAEGDGITTKLVVPNSQVLYRDLPESGLGDVADRARIAESLVGATPYPLEELVWDWERAGDRLHVAAVARETLEEAEDFAAEHGFNPISFVALPEDGFFAGEPFFGPSQMAPTLLHVDEKVEPDNATIRILSDTAVDDGYPVPDPMPGAPHSTEEPLPPKAQDGVFEDSGEDQTASISGPDETETEDDPGAASGIVFEPSTDQSPTAPIPDDTTAGAESADLPAEFAGNNEEDRSEGSSESNLNESPPSSETKTHHAPRIIRPPTPDYDATEADVLTEERDPSSSDGAPKEIASESEREVETDDPADTDVLPVATFASIRVLHEDPEPTVETKPDDPETDTPKTAPDVSQSEVDTETLTAADQQTGSSHTANSHETPPPVLPDAEPEPASHSPGITGPAAETPPATPKNATQAPKPLAKPRPTMVAPPRQTRAPRNETEAMTVFGARKQEPSLRKPAKLVVAGAAAILLAGLAVWFFGPDSTSAPDIDAPVASMPGTVEDSQSVGIQPAPQVPAQAQSPGQMDLDAAIAAYGTSGIWQRAPESGFATSEDTLADLYVASLDPVVPNQDAFALPRLDPESDFRPKQPPTPRVPNRVGTLGADGLVIATETGALSPLGIYVYAGEPFIVPPKRPVDLDTSAGEQIASISNPLARFRPRSRPDALTDASEKATLGGRTRSELARIRPVRRPTSTQETADELDLAQRMADSQTAEQQTAEAEDPVTEAVADAVDAALAADLETATRLAVAGSPVPRLRPANIGQIASRARAQADQERQIAAQVAAQNAAKATEDRARAQQAAAIAAATSAARKDAASKAAAEAARKKQIVAEAAAAEAAKKKKAADKAAAAAAASSSRSGPAVPRSQRARPSKKTAAAVAKRATIKNALALNKVSLIGVYGSSKQRRALVRLPSGKYNKVKLGDRLDGGRVVAIGKSDLRYQKKGRTITLKMPKG